MSRNWFFNDLDSGVKATLVGLTASILIVCIAILTRLGESDLPPISPEFQNGRFISARTVERLDLLLNDADYDLAEVRSGKAAVPALFLRRLPTDLGKVKDANKRKDLFIRALLPMTLAANRILRRQHDILIDLSTRKDRLSEEEKTWLRRLGIRHKVKNPTPEALMERVAPLPVALMIAQAAVESGWGTSRFAIEGNALFGQWTWEPGAGIVPEGREEGKTHAIKAYSRLIDSVWDYANNLNAHRAYDDFRKARAKRLKSGAPLNALPLIDTLEKYSERGEAYLDLLEGMIAQNDLSPLNRARLANSKQD